jgi:decaprenylphospho-beta-D-erythro-pentofuranosid-2-ulose 2-reductase
MRRVLVLGATSAIAAEVARLHSERGDRLHLVGRNPDKLAALVKSLTHSQVTSSSADFADLRANEARVTAAIDALGGTVDTVLIAHGDLGDQRKSEDELAEAQRIIVANFTSVVSLLIPVANHLERVRGKGGRVGVLASVAGDRGRPRNYTYGAAKGALHVYLQGLRTRLYPAGVTVTTLKLGPVDTPMTVDHEKTALFGKVDKVAADIVKAMDQGVAEAYVPFFWGAIMPLVKLAPEQVVQALPFLSGR